MNNQVCNWWYHFIITASTVFILIYNSRRTHTGEFVQSKRNPAIVVFSETEIRKKKYQFAFRRSTQPSKLVVYIHFSLFPPTINFIFKWFTWLICSVDCDWTVCKQTNKQHRTLQGNWKTLNRIAVLIPVELRWMHINKQFINIKWFNRTQNQYIKTNTDLTLTSLKFQKWIRS